MAEKNYPRLPSFDAFALFNISSLTSERDLKIQYRILCLKSHPDKRLNDVKATTRMQAINIAYETLIRNAAGRSVPDTKKAQGDKQPQSQPMKDQPQKDNPDTERRSKAKPDKMRQRSGPGKDYEERRRQREEEDRRRKEVHEKRQKEEEERKRKAYEERQRKLKERFEQQKAHEQQQRDAAQKERERRQKICGEERLKAKGRSKVKREKPEQHECRDKKDEIHADHKAKADPEQSERTNTFPKGKQQKERTTQQRARDQAKTGHQREHEKGTIRYTGVCSQLLTKYRDAMIRALRGCPLCVREFEKLAGELQEVNLQYRSKQESSIN